MEMLRGAITAQTKYTILVTALYPRPLTQGITMWTLLVGEKHPDILHFFFPRLSRGWR